jgi:hypothetical protein
MNDPLRIPNQELISAWDAAHRIRETESLDQLNAEWASVLNHLEKLWVKTGIACKASRAGFENWNKTWLKIREEDSLLVYMRQARHADNHSAQFLSSQVVGHLMIVPGRGLGFSLLDTPELAVSDVRNRGVLYQVPDSHLGQPLNTRDPRVLSVHGCNFYAEYLQEVRHSFLRIAP